MEATTLIQQALAPPDKNKEVYSKPEKLVRKISDDFTAGGSMYETIDDFDINDELLDDIGTISNVKAV